jgi:hypothetical protein
MQRFIMRFTVFAFLALTSAAQAHDCKQPRYEDKEIKGLKAFTECVIGTLSDLEQEQARLLDEIKTLKAALAQIPGELVNLNGRKTRRGGDSLAQARFTLSSRSRDGTTSLDIDAATLDELCAVGCSLTLTLTAQGLRAADVAPVFATGPCVFRYSATSGAWTTSTGCGEAATGVDGNGTPAGASGGELIATVGEACRLADSEPRRSVDPEDQPLGRDRKKGIHLIADATLWTGNEERFQCDLKLAR